MTDTRPSSSNICQPRSGTIRTAGRGLLGGLALTLVAASACGSDASGPDCADAIENTVEAATFAASLNVDVSALTKNNANVYFQDITVGSGPLAEPGDAVRMEYTGWFTDGTVFDAGTFDFIIGLGQVIIGWDRGIEGMQLGGRRLLVLPPSVGYGLCDARGIPGNSILVFQVDLIEIF